MYITDDSDLKYDRNKQERLPFWATFPVCGSYFISESDNLYLKNQIISFFTFFFSSEFSLMSNFS